MKAKNWSTVIEYAESIRDGKKVACLELKQAVDRFFRDLDNPEYEVNPKAPEFCIQIIEKTIKHQQGERIDGTPLRGTPFLLEPFHKFIIYNLVGFYHKGTGIVRFHEALIFIPRKNIKTSFAAALAWALSLWYRRSGSKVYIASAALMQSLESFNCIGNKNKPPAMQVCSQKALASRKNLHVIMSLRFANQIQYNKEVSEWITTVYHTQNGHANII